MMVWNASFTNLEGVWARGLEVPSQQFAKNDGDACPYLALAGKRGEALEARPSQGLQLERRFTD